MQDRGEESLARRDFMKSCMAAAAGLLVPASFGSGKAEAALRTGEGIPKVTLPDVKGNSVTLPDDAQGKVMLVHFWASWCSFCEKEMTIIASVSRSYKERGVIPYSVNVGESQAVVQAYVTRLNVSHAVLLDADSQTARRYGITGLPTTLLCDRKGTVRFKILGELSQQGLKKLLGSLI